MITGYLKERVSAFKGQDLPSARRMPWDMDLDLRFIAFATSRRRLAKLVELCRRSESPRVILACLTALKEYQSAHGGYSFRLDGLWGRLMRPVIRCWVKEPDLLVGMIAWLENEVRALPAHDYSAFRQLFFVGLAARGVARRLNLIDSIYQTLDDLIDSDKFYWVFKPGDENLLYDLLRDSDIDVTYEDARRMGRVMVYLRKAAGAPARSKQKLARKMNFRAGQVERQVERSVKLNGQVERRQVERCRSS